MTDEPDETGDEYYLPVLRRASFYIVQVGSVVSLILLSSRRENAPILIFWLFIAWVLAPYILYTSIHGLKRYLQPLARKTLYIAMIAVTVISNLIYLKDALWPPTSTRAFVWVIVPPMMCAAVIVAVGIAAFVVRQRRS